MDWKCIVLALCVTQAAAAKLGKFTWMLFTEYGEGNVLHVFVCLQEICLLRRVALCVCVCVCVCEGGWSVFWGGLSSEWGITSEGGLLSEGEGSAFWGGFVSWEGSSEGMGVGILPSDGESASLLPRDIVNRHSTRMHVCFVVFFNYFIVLYFIVNDKDS